MGIVVTRWHLESTRTLRHLFMSLLALYTLGLVGHHPLGCPKLSALNIFSRYHYSLDYMWDTCLCEAHKRACEEAPQRTMLQSEKHEHVLFIFMETDMPMTSLRCCYRVFFTVTGSWSLQCGKNYILGRTNYATQVLSTKRLRSTDLQAASLSPERSFRPHGS